MTLARFFIPALLGLLMIGCAAAPETVERVNAISGVLLDSCKKKILVGGLPEGMRNAAIGPIVVARDGTFRQPCAFAEIGMLRSKEYKANAVISRCEIQRANLMKKFPSLLVEPCQIFILEGKVVW
jgi:hypothetical protein